MPPFKGFIKDDPNFKKLFENTVMLLGHVFENAYLYNKFTREETGIFQFSNDPACGLVGKNNDWCLVGGDRLILQTLLDNTISPVGDLGHIHDLKSIDSYTTQILTDPWAKDAAIWQLELDLTNHAQLINLYKVKEFTGYVGKPYSEAIDW